MMSKDKPAQPAPEKIEKGWRPIVEGGYQGPTGDAGTPPTGGGGGKEAEKGKKD